MAPEKIKSVENSAAKPTVSKLSLGRFSFSLEYERASPDEPISPTYRRV